MKSKYLYLYDVIEKKQTRRRLDRKIPYGCKTITFDTRNVFIIGGELNN